MLNESDGFWMLHIKTRQQTDTFDTSVVSPWRVHFDANCLCVEGAWHPKMEIQVRETCFIRFIRSIRRAGCSTSENREESVTITTLNLLESEECGIVIWMQMMTNNSESRPVVTLQTEIFILYYYYYFSCGIYIYKNTFLCHGLQQVSHVSSDFLTTLIRLMVKTLKVLSERWMSFPKLIFIL